MILFFLGLEIASLLLGGSLFGIDGDTPDIDAPQIDTPAIDAPDFHSPDVNAPDLDAPDAGAGEFSGAAGGILSWLGLGEAPFMVWLTGLLAAFGLTGYVAQLVLRETTGSLFTAWPIAIGAAVVGLVVAKRLSRLIARLLPRVQSEAVSERRLGGRVGVVTVGTARLGRPAEAKVSDRFGNVHYVRVQPARIGEELPAGTEIAILNYKDRVYTAVRLDRP